MSDKPSMTVWEHWLRSAEKFDYFIAGLSSALTAFVAQGLGTTRPGINASGLASLSAALLCGAVAASLDGIRYRVASLSANALELQHAERKGNLVSLLITGGSGHIVDDAGTIYTMADVQNKIAYHDNALSQVTPQAARFKTRSERSYTIRDALLLSGLAVYVASRIWRAYS